MVLRYDNEVQDWKDGLCIGNGRLNGVVWNDQVSDRISLNHEALWTGLYGSRHNQKRDHFLPYVREFLKEKDYYRATVLTSMAFGGDGGISPYPRREDMYIPAGDFVFYHGGGSDGSLKRNLDMERGVAEVEYKNIHLEAFADCISQWICLRWCSPKTMSGMLAFEHEPYAEKETGHITIKENSCEMVTIVLVDTVCSYEVHIHIETDGTLLNAGQGVEVNNATYIEGYVNIAVSYCHIDKELEEHKISLELWNRRLEKHETKFAGEMGKSAIRIADEETEMLQKYSINQRLERLRNGENDAELMGLYSEFSKYLLVSGSICGKFPLNLQGKWNCDPVPPWNCDYHFNINIQMNYWCAEQLNLAEYITPLFDYAERFAESGKEAARLLYGCRGTCLSLNGDHWAVSTPEAYNYAAWIGGGAWIAQHYWWHYRYGGDRNFLREKAYPFFKLVAEFYEDFIQVDENGTAQLAPSQSPENCFKGTGEFPVSFCTSSAMDVQLAYDALTYAIESSRILKVNQQQCQVWEGLRNKLPEFKIGADGRLLEWDEEREEMEKGHRHFSHLYGLFPSNLFHRQCRKEQYEAAGKSLNYRLEHSGGGTGWSRAWAACLYARLGAGNQAYEQMKCLLTELSSSALLDLHPKPARCRVRNPQNGYVFQIDGNMGGGRAVLECLIQSYDGRVYILPALPKEWRSGEVAGIKTEGGHELSFCFRNGELTSLELIMGFEGSILIDNANGRLGEEKELCISGKPGSHITMI